MIFRAEMLAMTALFGALTFLLGKVSPQNIGAAEKLCRDRLIGLLIALPCTLMCVPLAVPVSPGFLIVFLWPLALALPILSYFHLDCYAARAWAFALILAGYDIIHGCFDRHIPLGGAVTVLMLIQTVAGMWFSAKPCLLRDLFRRAAESRRVRIAAVLSAALFGIVPLYVLIMTFSEH